MDMDLDKFNCNVLVPTNSTAPEIFADVDQYDGLTVLTTKAEECEDTILLNVPSSIDQYDQAILEGTLDTAKTACH